MYVFHKDNQGRILGWCVAACWTVFIFRYLRLELLTQVPASNDENREKWTSSKLRYLIDWASLTLHSVLSISVAFYLLWKKLVALAARHLPVTIVYHLKLELLTQFPASNYEKYFKKQTSKLDCVMKWASLQTIVSYLLWKKVNLARIKWKIHVECLGDLPFLLGSLSSNSRKVWLTSNKSRKTLSIHPSPPIVWCVTERPRET